MQPIHLALLVAWSQTGQSHVQTQLLGQLVGTEGASCVCFDQVGSELSVSLENGISIFQAKISKQIARIENKSACLFSTDEPASFIGLDGWTLFRTGKGQQTRAVNISKNLITMTVSDERIFLVASTEDGQKVYFTNEDRLFKLSASTGLITQPYKDVRISAARAFIYRRKLYCGGYGCPTVPLDAKGIPSFLVPKKEYIEHLAFCQKTSTVFLSGEDGSFQAINLITGQHLFRRMLSQPPSALTCSPNGSVVVVGFAERLPRRDRRYRRNAIFFADSATGKFLAVPNIATTGVTSLAFSPDGAVLAESERYSPVKLISVREVKD